jgi:hypothetical protein
MKRDSCDATFLSGVVSKETEKDIRRGNLWRYSPRKRNRIRERRWTTWVRGHVFFIFLGMTADLKEWNWMVVQSHVSSSLYVYISLSFGPTNKEEAILCGNDSHVHAIGSK